MQNTLLGLPAEFWAIACIAIAAAYTVFWPRPPRTATIPRSGWQYLVLRWFHAATWLCLGLAALAFKYVGGTAAQLLGLLAVVFYLVFMAAFVRERMRYPQG